MIKKVGRLAGHWILDYLHAFHKHSYAFIYKDPPDHYLGFIQDGKFPIILIPGHLEKWHFLKAIADPLSLKGYPVYEVGHIGYHTIAVHQSAELIRELIDEKKLKNVILIAHSKGGLVGKHLLAFNNSDGVIKKLITIATPWAGSHAARMVPHKIFHELRPQSETVNRLHAQKNINNKVVSIFGFFDNHVWPTKSCFLEGAKNIRVNTHGHHTILFTKETIDLVAKEVEDVERL